MAKNDPDGFKVGSDQRRADAERLKAQQEAQRAEQARLVERAKNLRHGEDRG